MSDLPSCPECNGTYTYEDNNLFICPTCSHEWSKFQDEFDAQRAHEEAIENAVRDAYGNILTEGSDGTIVRDIKINGSSETIKQGTWVQDIRFETDGVHDLVAKVDGFGLMALKSELIKKD